MSAFVRDQGSGFDPDTVPEDRHGIRESIVGRLARHGGTANVTSSPAGTEVVCWIASANRDEARWGANADDLDITREDARQHLAFGKGPHVCLGSWLARLELQVVLATILGRFPNTELVDQELRWTNDVIRGPEELLIDLRP